MLGPQTNAVLTKAVDNTTFSDRRMLAPGFSSSEGEKQMFISSGARGPPVTREITQLALRFGA
jgi:hypothetical protein